jgi:hypothetical protein
MAQKFVEVSQANFKRVTALQDVVKARQKWFECRG